MRVGFLGYGVYGERATGIARYAVELTRALRELDASLEIVLLNPHPGSGHPWFDEFPSVSLRGVSLLPALATAGNWTIHRAATELELDVLHDPAGIAPFLVPGTRYRRVTTVHDAIPAVYPDTQPFLTRLLFATLVRAAGRTADAILTVSQASAADLAQHYGLTRAKIHVTPNGVRPWTPLDARFVDDRLAALGVRKRYFLYVGALHPRKNIGRVLEAFQAVHAERPEVGLAIVGPRSWGAQRVVREALDRTIDADAVTFTGFVPDEDLQALYQGAFALVFPTMYEGFGLPVLEAMSVGTPVVTSTTSSLPEVAGDAALLVDPTWVPSIADAMIRLLDEPMLASDLARRGRERVKSFSWTRTAEATRAVYDSVLLRGDTV